MHTITVKQKDLKTISVLDGNVERGQVDWTHIEPGNEFSNARLIACKILGMSSHSVAPFEVNGNGDCRLYKKT